MSTDTLNRYRALELSRQVDEEADQLWATGKLALVLRLLLEDAQRLVGALGTSPDVKSAEVSALEELCQQGSQLGLPALERELTPAHRELLQRLASDRKRCVEQLRSAESRTKRRRRAIAAAAAFAALALGAYMMFRNAPTATVSSSYGSDFPASHLVDGLKTTEWLLPHQQTGWVELTFARPRDVKAVRLQNSVNGHYRDRASKAVKLEAYARTQVVATAKAEFPPIEATKGPIKVDLVARGVTHVRIEIESYYGGGGGLAEVDIE